MLPAAVVDQQSGSQESALPGAVRTVVARSTVRLTYAPLTCIASATLGAAP